MAMASHDITNQQQQQTWVPYEQAKDCSQGFCSIYCPQWCYIIFPPPPPFSFIDSNDDDSSSSSPFSPLVIAIIGILASAFLLVSYYTIISKYCGGFRRRPRNNNPNEPIGDNNEDDDDIDGDELRLRETTWHVSPSNGLDQALIDKITVYKYKRGDGVVDGTDCSVCLGEFREEESLRLLPKCSHAFHLPCIDTWLSSHSNCPLCRANIVSVQAIPPPVVEGERNNETVVVINNEEEEEEGEDQEEEELSNCEENDHEVIEIRDDIDDEDRSLSMDSPHRRRVSIGDILKMNMGEECLMVISNGSSSSRSKGENSKGRDIDRSLHCVMSPKPMKRSMSSGRLNFSRHGKGRNSVIPI